MIIMGCEEWVAVYKKADVLKEYELRFPENNIDDDWWYMDKLTGKINGVEYLFCFTNTCNDNSFADDFWFEDSEALERVLKVLKQCKPVCQPQLWT